MSEKLLVPDIGEFENVEVIELLVKEGEEIKRNDPIVTIESDKSSVEIPSTIDGKIEKISVKIGDKVSKGDLLLTVAGSKSSYKTLENVPKNTENLIQEAETSLQKSQDEITNEPKIQQSKVENKKFDPNFHQAMSELEDDKKEPGTILQEVQAGYMFGERLLRPALVTVSKIKSSKDQENKDKKDEK